MNPALWGGSYVSVRERFPKFKGRQLRNHVGTKRGTGCELQDGVPVLVPLEPLWRPQLAMDFI